MLDAPSQNGAMIAWGYLLVRSHMGRAPGVGAQLAASRPWDAEVPEVRAVGIGLGRTAVRGTGCVCRTAALPGTPSEQVPAISTRLAACAPGNKAFS